MPELRSSQSARELLTDLLPKHKANEHFLGNTLAVKIQRCLDPTERLRLKNIKMEFELELAMIRMNLEHLLRRYSAELLAVKEDEAGEKDTLLALDEHEAVAIESLRRLYARSHELQTDSTGPFNE